MSFDNEIPNHLLQPALDVNSSPLRRAASNASMTHVQEGAKADVYLTIFKMMLERLKCQPVGHSFDPDALAAERLARMVIEKVQAIPEFAEFESLSLAEKHKFIRQLSSGRPSPPVRALVDVAESVVNDEFAVVRKHLNHAAGINPHSASLIADTAQETTGAMRVPDFDHAPVSRLSNVVRVRGKLTEDPSFLPTATRENVVDTLEQRGESLATAAMLSVCVEQVAVFIRQSLKSLSRLIKEIKLLGGTFNQNVADTRLLMEEQRRDAKHRDAAPQSGIELVLQGPDEPSLIGSMLEQETLDDIEELNARHFETLQVRLAKVAGLKYPALGEHAPVGQLFARISPEDIVDQLREVVDQSIGNRHTVYSALRATDADEFAEEILKRANVLVHLGGHRHERLHIQPIEQVLVRFPQRIGDDDEQTYTNLREAFAERFHGILFADAGKEERDIKCVRTLIGFPFGIDLMNSCFLDAYCNCEPHPPHLYGILSEDGQPIPEIKALQQRRKSSAQKGKRNGR
jgi:hypothetical protein